MKMYRVGTLHSDRTEVKEFEIEEDTGDYVVFNRGRKEKKESNYQTWFHTLKASLGFAIQRQERVIRRLDNEMKKAIKCRNELQDRLNEEAGI